MNSLAQRQEQFVAILESRPRGISAEQLGAEVGLSKWRALEILRSLRKLGRAAVTPAGENAVWTTPQRVDVLYGIQVYAQAQRRRERDRRSDRKRRLKREAEDFARSSRQNWLPAGSYAFALPACPISVFHQVA